MYLVTSSTSLNQLKLMLKYLKVDKHIKPLFTIIKSGDDHRTTTNNIFI